MKMQKLTYWNISAILDAFFFGGIWFTLLNIMVGDQLTDPSLKFIHQNHNNLWEMEAVR